MEIRVLGPLEAISDDGTFIDVGPLKRRVVLGMLAVERGRVVATERLIDAVWGEDPPSSALATLQGLVYQLRQLLGTSVIESRAPGYALSSSIEVDVDRLAITRESIGELEATLALFRGRPLDDLGEGAVVAAVRQHLVDARLELFERWCDAMMTAGRAVEVVQPIERELLSTPWRESLWEQLMLALYRANRQADSLAAFGRARATLVGDLGLEPGPSLRALEQRILVQDPSLDVVPVAGPALPSGDVTFLLTDIVGSTRLWEQSAQAMEVALGRQETILDSVVGRHGGVLLKTRGEGDSTFSVFESPEAALAAALDAQLALIAEPWPEGATLSVRMALHSGEAIERNADYFGPTVNRAARLRAMAFGAEILVSAAIVERCASLPADVSLDDLGLRQLRDVVEHVHVVRHPLLPTRVDGVPTVPTRRTALTPTGTAFVGRAGELAHLRQRHGRADGLGAVSMVMGEPGIGKTRLVAEVADGLADDGYVVMWGRSPEGEWASPYAPFVEGLERYLASIEPDQARRLLGTVVAPLAHVLPIVHELFSTVVPSENTDAEQRRFEILDAFSRLLEAIAASYPVLVVLDDLHWVDQASSSALSFVLPLTARAAVHIIGTYRDTEVPDTHPVAIALASAQRDVRIDRIRLRGFSATNGRELVEQLGAPSLSSPAIDELMTASGGNPFFLGELIRFRAENADGVIPDSVNDALQQRLARLRADTNLLLRIGALFDERFPLEISRLVVDLDEDAALDALDEAITAHLVEPTDVIDEYRFVHALARVAVQSTINPSRLPRLHRRIATTLDEQSIAGDPVVWSRVAYHYHASRALPGAERGVEAALAAAEHADTVAAHRERARLLQIALDLMPADDSRCARTTANLVLALVRADDWAAATQPAMKAGDLLAVAEGGQAACDFFAELRATWEDSGGDGGLAADILPNVIEWSARGMAFAEQIPSASHDYLYTTHWFDRINLLGDAMYRERAHLWVDPTWLALGTRALRGQAPHVHRWAVYAAAKHRDDLPSTIRTKGDYKFVLADSIRIAESCRQRGLRGERVRGHSNAAAASACLGDLDLARRHVAEMTEAVSGPIDAGHVLTAALGLFVVDWIADGPWEQFKRSIDSLCAGSELNELAWSLGQQHSSLPSVNAIATMMQARNGELDRGLCGVRVLLDFLEHADVHESSYSFIAHVCAEITWLAADVDLVSLLEPLIRNRWLPCDFRHFGCDVRLSLARLCAVDGRVGEATEWFDAARRVFREQGARPMLAIADFDEAWMHVRHPGHLGHDAVADLLDRATVQFTEIGMAGWARRSEELRHVSTVEGAT